MRTSALLAPYDVIGETRLSVLVHPLHFRARSAARLRFQHREHRRFTPPSSAGCTLPVQMHVLVVVQQARQSVHVQLLELEALRAEADLTGSSMGCSPSCCDTSCRLVATCACLVRVRTVATSLVSAVDTATAVVRATVFGVGAVSRVSCVATATITTTATTAATAVAAAATTTTSQLSTVASTAATAAVADTDAATTSTITTAVTDQRSITSYWLRRRPMRCWSCRIDSTFFSRPTLPRLCCWLEWQLALCGWKLPSSRGSS